ncbi:hypothetical protein V3C99_014777 [Haemonchus contortus]
MSVFEIVCLIAVLQAVAVSSADELFEGSYEYDDDETTTTTNKPTPTPARNQQLQCDDMPSFGFLSCSERRHLCDNPFFSIVMKMQCARTCGMCGDAPILQRDQECTDGKDIFGFDNCAFRKAFCDSPDLFLRRQTQQDCPKSCGLCK